MTDRLPPTVNRKEYPAIDILKFILAIFVVSIHIEPFSSFEGEFTDTLYYYEKNVLARVGVPFYFAAAGFLLSRKIDFQAYDPEIGKRYVSKTLRLLATWVIILSCEEQIHLWYMGALVVAVLFLDILLKRKVSLKTMLFIAIPLYIFGLLGTTYYGLFAPVRNSRIFRYLNLLYIVLFKTTRNGIFMGFPYVLIGAIAAKREIQIGRWKAWGGVLLSLALLFLEGRFIKERALALEYSMYVSLLPLVFFLLTAATESKLTARPFYKNLRIAGVIVYFSHFFVQKLVMLGFSAISSFTGIMMPNSLLIFSTTVLLSALLGLLIAVLSEKPKLSFLKNLY